MTLDYDSIDNAVENVIRDTAATAKRTGYWPDWAYFASRAQMLDYLDRWMANSPAPERDTRIAAASMWETWRRLHEPLP